MLSFLKSSSNNGAGWFSRLRDGLAKTREQLGGRIAGLFGASRPLDEAFYEELETVLIAADVGVAASAHLLAELRRRARREGIADSTGLKHALQAALRELLQPIAVPLEVDSHRPFVIMLAGVNGAGKTTSIGKLAHYFQGRGKSVLLAAGDTFRAAAREQLIAWGERNNVAVITQQSGDAAAVIYDAVNAAKARGIDVVLADTAGRLPTQLHLMEEIKKVKRVIAKARPGRAARSAAGARCQHRPERAGAGARVRRGARGHRPHPDQARRHRQGRRDRGHRARAIRRLAGEADTRALHRRWRERSTTCGRSTPGSSSPPFLIEER